MREGLRIRAAVSRRRGECVAERGKKKRNEGGWRAAAKWVGKWREVGRSGAPSATQVPLLIGGGAVHEWLTVDKKRVGGRVPLPSPST